MVGETQVPNQAEATVGIGRILYDHGNSITLEMSVAEWIRVEDHPRQRDSLRQIRKHHWRLAQRAQGALREQQRFVVGAEFGGRVYKVDGHARARLWQSNELVPPKSVICTVHRCATWDELLDLIAAFDSQDAAQTQFDRVTGAYRECGLNLTSKRLRGGTIVDALAISMRGVARSSDKSALGAEFDVYEAVKTYAKELAALDAIDPQPEVFHTGIVAAALIAQALNPAAIKFFEQLGKRDGAQRDQFSDPVQAILNVLDSLKRRRAGWEKAQQEELCAVCLRAAFAFQAGEESVDYWCSSVPAPVDLQAIVARARTAALR
jgi:hypothetical protein